MKSLFSNLNARLLLIQLVAFGFFFYAFQSFAYLHDHVFFNPVSNSINRATFPERYTVDEGIIEQAGNFGLLLGYVISWFICSKRGWHWLNGVLAFLIAFTLGNVTRFSWSNLYKIFLIFGRSFEVGSIWRYWTDGFVMLIIGSLLLFLNVIKRFIDRGDPEYKSQLEGEKEAKRIK